MPTNDPKFNLEDVLDQETDEIRPYIKHNKDFGYNKNFGGHSKKFGDYNKMGNKGFNKFAGSGEYEGKEQVGMEDAEPVECNKEESNYGVADSFDQYDLPNELKRSMRDLGYDKPFEIQKETLQHTLQGRLVLIAFLWEINFK